MPFGTWTQPRPRCIHPIETYAELEVRTYPMKIYINLYSAHNRSWLSLGCLTRDSSCAIICCLMYRSIQKAPTSISAYHSPRFEFIYTNLSTSGFLHTECKPRATVNTQFNPSTYVLYNLCFVNIWRSNQRPPVHGECLYL